MRSYNWHPRSKNEAFEDIIYRLVPLDNGCIVWPGAISNDGYGQIGYDNKVVYTHRLVYEFINDIKLTRKEHLHHLCKTRRCANFNHLQIFTNSQHKWLELKLRREAIRAKCLKK